MNKTRPTPPEFNNHRYIVSLTIELIPTWMLLVGLGGFCLDVVVIKHKLLA